MCIRDSRQFVPLLRFFEDHLRNFVVTFARAYARSKARLEFSFDILDRAIRDARRARVRFQVTALTAFAPTRILRSVDQIVTGFTPVTVRAVPNVTVQNDSATNPGAKRQKNQPLFAFPSANPLFGKRRRWAVVRKRDGKTAVLGKTIAYREEIPTRKIRGTNQRTGWKIKRSRRTKTDACDVARFETSFRDRFVNCGGHSLRSVVRSAFYQRRRRNIRTRFALVGEKADRNIGAAEVEADIILLGVVRQ